MRSQSTGPGGAATDTQSEDYEGTLPRDEGAIVRTRRSRRRSGVCAPFTPAGLQEEALSPEERQRQRYVNEPEVGAPSIVTLNASAVGHATNDFLFSFLGIAKDSASSHYLRIRPRERLTWLDEPTASAACLECGHVIGSRRAMGDSLRLPTRSPR